MRAAIIRFPGSNCDRDLAVAFSKTFGESDLSSDNGRSLSNSSVSMVWHKDTSLPKGTDVIGIPGGFSFGDYLRCGALAARSPIMNAVARFADDGGYVIGTCNGFQVLTESGLLPGTLIRNAGIRFLCMDVELEVGTTSSAFTCRFEREQVVRLPIAHLEGNYRTDPDTLTRLRQEDRIAFRYQDNPNGSLESIAGVLSENRRVLGLMPHPERQVDALTGGTDGRRIFEGIVAQLLAS